MTQEILRLHGVRKYYGPKLILDGVDLTLNRGERLALVGENGVGKTTLTRIIIGAEPSDSGAIHLRDETTIGYLPQAIVSDEAIAVQQYIEQATGELDRLRHTLRQLEKRMTQELDVTELENTLQAYGRAQEEFERRGGYTIDARIGQVFEGLGISHIDPQRMLHTLSGGERTRVALTALLLREPDLLILDEPTNHLDFAGIDWLEQYLSAYQQALLLITHDRTFINRVANVISELSASTRRLHTYHGDYDAYLAQRQREYEGKVAAYNEQKNEMKALQRSITMQTHNTSGKIHPSTEGDKFIRFHKNSQSDKTKRRKIKEAQNRLSELQQNPLDNPRHEWRVEFRFDPLPLPSSEPLRMMHLSKSHNDSALFTNLTATVNNGERVVLVAPNGSGKSTLLRLIMGLAEPDVGVVKWSPSATVGYLDQDGETLDEEQTVLECFRNVIQGSDSELLAELHRSGLFGDATLGHKRVADLSVGQRRKLGLARIIASRANVLLLDEPTNHLDPLSLEALEAALMSFSGTVLAVSHDRRFVQKVATRIWTFEHRTLVERLPDAL